MPGVRIFRVHDVRENRQAADEKGENVISVNQPTLDEALDGAPLCIKIDVEGYEMPALQGGLNTLKNKRLCAVIMELNDSGNRYGYDEEVKLNQIIAAAPWFGRNAKSIDRQADNRDTRGLSMRILSCLSRNWIFPRFE